MVQAVLLLDADTWVVTPCMVRFLGEFQDQVVRNLTERLPQKKTDGKW